MTGVENGITIGLGFDRRVSPVIRANSIAADEIGIRVLRSAAVLESNTIVGGKIGIVLLDGEPTLVGGPSSGRERRIRRHGDDPDLGRDRIRGNDLDLVVSEANASWTGMVHGRLPLLHSRRAGSAPSARPTHPA